MGLLSHLAHGPQRTPSHSSQAFGPHTSMGNSFGYHDQELLDERNNGVRVYTTMEVGLEFAEDSLVEVGS